MAGSKEELPAVINKAAEIVDPDKASQWIEMGRELALTYGIKLLAAIAIFIIGKMVANWVKRLVVKVMNKSDVDPMIISFTSSITYTCILIKLDKKHVEYRCQARKIF